MKRLSVIAVLLAVFLCGYSQERKYLKISVAFYNVENLFDTLHQEGVNDYEFTPDGTNRWSGKRYMAKLKNLSEAISQISGNGPAILGVSEIENRSVLEDLINMPALKDKNYDIVHYDSPDARGVDVGLIYQKHIFTVIESDTHPVILEEDPGFRTRDILQATGIIDGEIFHFMVAHWPSRSGGEKISEHKRMAAAKVMKKVSDSLLAKYPGSKVVMMGDLNDDPVNKSIRDGLGAKDKARNLADTDLFNPMHKMYKDGHGSLAYRDAWSLFDQMIVSGNLIGTDYSSFKLYQDPKTKNYAYVFNRPFLAQKEGKYKGYPWRTIVGGQFQGGYSDHFPVYLYLVKEVAL